MKYSITTFPRICVAYYRHIGPYGEAQEIWEKLATLAAKHRLYKGADTLCVGACHDDPANVPLNELRSDACIAVDSSFTPCDGAEVQELGGGRYVTTTYKGPYSGIGLAYEDLYVWIRQQGLEPMPGPTLEIYRNDPHVTPEEELITDLHAPIR